MTEPSSDSFKAPSLPGKSITEPEEPVPKKASEPNKSVQSEPPPPLKYKCPDWASNPPQDSSYSLQVLKNGAIIDTIAMPTNRNFITIGRLAVCDIQLEHPSISRYHAVMQFGKDTMQRSEASKLGWHLYDLGSTHGSFRNKQRLPAKQYVRVHVGHVMKFGGSTRLLILEGPPEDAEPESKYSVTEIKQRAERRRLIAEGVLDPNVANEEGLEQGDHGEVENSSGEHHATWGISDNYGDPNDRDSDEEKDDEKKGEDIDFEVLREREAYYKDDPKKALRVFCDREGIDMEFEYTEKGTTFKHQWVCRIELPIQTERAKSVIAEATVSGGKREAQVQCALEACRILDAQDLLRRTRTQVDSHRQQKLRELRDNDFYDSDEDTFFDRTGEIEEKRAVRKRRLDSNEDSGAVKQKAQTYDMICAQLDAVQSEIAGFQQQLDALTAGGQKATESKPNRRSDDTLDEFMTQVHAADSVVDETKDSIQVKVQKSQLRQKIVQLKQDADRLNKLAKVAKPIALPSLRPPTKVSGGETKAGDTSTAEESSKKAAPKQIWVGSMKGHRLRRTAAIGPVELSTQPTTSTEPSQTAITDQQNVEVEEENDEEPIVSETSVDVTNGADTPDKSVSSTTKKSYTVEMPPDLPTEDVADEIQGDSGTEHESANDVEQSDAKPDVDEIKTVPSKRSRTRVRQRDRERKPKPNAVGDGYDARNPDYATWLPPDTQSGDGKTSLNEKFGY